MPITARFRLLVHLAALLPLVLAGCGEKVVGGRGSLEPGADGRPALLVVEGSPYQMGWWQGRLLRDEIRSLHAAWQADAIQSQVGLAHDLELGAAGDLKATIGYFIDQTLGAVPESVRQELEGMADATDLSVSDLLFTEVMRDGLRIWLGRMEPRLPGVLAARKADTGTEARAVWWGPDAEVLAGHWIVVERRPVQGASSVVLSWPGSVGGIAGIADTGLAFLLGEAEVDAAFRGFGHGMPYPVGARIAIESDRNSARMRGALKGTAGHTLIVLAGADDDGFDGRTAIGSVEIYRGMQPELDFTEGRTSFALGPWQDVLAAMKQLEEAGDAADRFDGAAVLVPADAAGRTEAEVRRTGSRLTLHVSTGGATRDVSLD